LPLSYIDGMQSYLKSYKKETCKAKLEGNICEEEADPIPIDLYRLILE